MLRDDAHWQDLPARKDFPPSPRKSIRESRARKLLLLRALARISQATFVSIPLGL